jgi:hypothetical protein
MKRASQSAMRRHTGKLVLFLVTASVLVVSLGSIDRTKSSSVPISEVAKPADSFVDSIGVNLHIHYLDTSYGHFDMIKSKLTELGVRHARDGAQLTATDANYDKLVYGRMRQLSDTGIRFDLIVDPRAITPLTGDKLAHIAELGGPALESLEGPNEYDNSGNKDWAKDLRVYQQQLYDLAKAETATKHLAILGPSLVHPESREKLGDISADMDYANVHCYPGGKDPLTHLDQELAMSKEVNGAHAILPTETGYHTATHGSTGHPGVSEAAAGKYVPRLFLEYFNHGFVRSYLYEFADEKPDPDGKDPEQSFGLIRADGSEKPAYDSLKNLIALLEDPGKAFQPAKFEYTLQGDTSNIDHTLLQKRNGRFYLILWNESSSYNTLLKTDLNVSPRSLTLDFGRSIREANVYMPSQSTSTIARNSNVRSITLQVPDHPLVVEIMQ